MGFRPLRQQIGRRARRALGALVAAALSGCVAGPNFIPPAAPGEAGYAMTGEETPAGVRLGQPLAGPWWSALGCAKLTATIDAALASSPTLAEAKARLSQARAVEAEARGAAYPEIDGNSGAQRERLNLSSFGLTSFPGISNNPTFNLYSVGATAAYLIPTTGLNRRRVESAQARAEARRHEGEAAVLTLSGQVAAAAAEIAAARAEIAADQAVIADDQRLVELARAAERAGGDAAGRRIGAQSALAADEAALPPVRQTLAAARHRLALLVGEPPSAMTPPDFDLADFHLPAEIPVSLPSELVRRRPDILQAEATAHAATAEVGVATAQL
jgi:NodT family efflux transporter outer membrane factor (OMF) lipoprotein